VKHKFLLDENILHFAIKGTNEKNEPDQTSTELVRLVAQNCHSIAVNRFLLRRYWNQINQIQREGRRPSALEPVFFITQLLKNSTKWAFEPDECPALPTRVVVPAEDVEIVRLALSAQTIIVTGDADLRTAVNDSHALGLQALTPADALQLAAES